MQKYRFYYPINFIYSQSFMTKIRVILSTVHFNYLEYISIISWFILMHIEKFNKID
jgi:hypothetical protein